MAVVQRATYEDLMTLPDDGARHELVRGEIIRMPPPNGKHGRIEAALVEEIGRYLFDRACTLGWKPGSPRLERNLLVGCVDSGEAGIRFALRDDPDQVRGVDVCYLTAEQVARHEAAGGDQYVPEVPAIVAEVISDSETAAYVNEQAADYLAGGARLVWLLFPKTRVVEAHTPDRAAITVTAGEVLDGGEVLPGFSVAVASLFS
jgi:Uma2 family endonuclease